MKPLVSMLLPSLAGGGAERSVVAVAAALLEQGLACELVVGTRDGALADSLPPSLPVRSLEVARMATAGARFARYLRRAKPNVVLSALTHANVVAIVAARLTRTPVIVCEHNTMSRTAASAEAPFDRFAPRLARFLYPLADAVVAVSDAAADDLAQIAALDRKRVHVIPNPVVTAALLAHARVPRTTTTSRPTIINVGRLEPQKDIDTLLRAFARLRREQAAELLLVGEGSCRTRLEELARQLGVAADVQFSGYVDNPYPLMASATVLALSSRYEGLPTVLIEALALGTPIVSTDCPSGPREILGEGRWGTLVPPEDPDALCTALSAVIAQPPPPVPQAAWLPYTEQAAVNSYRALLERCMRHAA